MKERQRLSYNEWLAHWGEQRVEEYQFSSAKCHKRMWEARSDESKNRTYPVWELTVGTFWHESIDEWQKRWVNVGGRIFENRMMASTWNPIWSNLAKTFPDGYSLPYPPYAKYTSVSWRSICADEAIVLGVLSEDEFQARIKKIAKPKGPLIGHNGKPMDIKELLGDEYENFMVYERLSRQERLDQKKERERLAAKRSEKYRIEREVRLEGERKEKNEMFRLLERLEGELKSASSEKIIEDSTSLFSSLRTLVDTEHFERYPKWRARAWKCAAIVHRELGNSLWEMDALRNALSSNPKIGVKRRLKTLERNTTG